MNASLALASTTLGTLNARVTALIWTAGAVLTLALCLAARTPLGGRTIVRISGVDSVCYFGTAHSLLFDRDFDLTNQFARLPPDPSEWTAVRPETGKPGSQFAIGFSLMQIPFLAVGYVASVVFGDADTLSTPVVLLY